MRILVSGGTATVSRLAARWPQHLGQLLTPANGNSVEAITATGLLWGADNGAYSGLDADAFRRMLRRIQGQPRLLWVCCPDRVGDARTTLDLFDQWREEVAAAGPVAFVGQDGQEDLPAPWDGFACLFIGGSTAWKLSQAAADLCREAKQRGKQVHVGRVNSLQRLQAAFDMGADSVDGKQWSAFGETYLEWGLRFCADLDCQPVLFAREG